MPDEVGARVQRDLAALGVNGDSAFYDARAGRLTSLILSEPLIPGDGVGNQLRWVDGAAQALDEDKVREVVWAAVRGFVQERQGQSCGSTSPSWERPRISVLSRRPWSRWSRHG